MAQDADLTLGLADVAQKRDPVRDLAGVLDGDELQVELELAPILPRGRRLGLERLTLEHVIEQRRDDRFVALDDAERHRASGR